MKLGGLLLEGFNLKDLLSAPRAWETLKWRSLSSLLPLLRGCVVEKPLLFPGKSNTVFTPIIALIGAGWAEHSLSNKNAD